MTKASKIDVQGADIGIDGDYISLTDMVKNYGGDQAIYNWLRNRNTVEFLGVWEQLNNEDFKGIEFERFRKEAGLNSFSLTPKKWIEATDAIGLKSKSGRYGGHTKTLHLSLVLGLVHNLNYI